MFKGKKTDKIVHYLFIFFKEKKNVKVVMIIFYDFASCLNKTVVHSGQSKVFRRLSFMKYSKFIDDTLY